MSKHIDQKGVCNARFFERLLYGHIFVIIFLLEYFFRFYINVKLFQGLTAEKVSVHYRLSK